MDHISLFLDGAPEEGHANDEAAGAASGAAGGRGGRGGAEAAAAAQRGRAAAAARRLGASGAGDRVAAVKVRKPAKDETFSSLVCVCVCVCVCDDICMTHA